jgi:hypothetical protein
MRKVKDVIVPLDSSWQSSSTGTVSRDQVAGGAESDPAVVEAELEKRLAKVVLEPWIGSDDKTGGPDFFEPKISGKSNGTAIDFDGKTVVGVGNNDVEVQGNVHDVRADVTVLAMPSVVSSLCVGMGLAGTYVQIARRKTEGGAKEARKRKKAKSKEQSVETFWYMEQVMMILPSYHA